MLHKKPVISAKDDANFVSRRYEFKALESLSAEEVEVTSADGMKMEASDFDRVFVILKGLGNVRMNNRSYELRGSEAENGTVGGRVSLFEVPAHQNFVISGMLKLLMITSRS